MRAVRTGRMLALGIVIGALSACGSGSAPTAPEPPAEPPAEAPITGPRTAPDDPATAPAPDTAAGTEASDPAPPADACARARTCCPAYVASLPHPGEQATAEQACASLELAIAGGGAPADAACQGALEGFRRSLEASGREIPPDCR